MSTLTFDNLVIPNRRKPPIKYRVARILSKLTFEKIAQHYRLRYYSGGNFCCWFHHEENPSARVREYPEGEVYTCYAECGRGNVLWAIGKLEGLEKLEEIVDFIEEEFPEVTKEKLKSRARIKVEEVKPKTDTTSLMNLSFEVLSENKFGSEYLSKRGIDLEIQKRFCIFDCKKDTYALSPELFSYFQSVGILTNGVIETFNRCCFPYYNIYNKVCGFICRALGTQDPKYLYIADKTLSPEGKNLYGLKQFLETGSRTLFVVEGPVDCLALQGFGVATLGTHFSRSQVKIIQSLVKCGFVDRVYILYDGDKSGRDSSLLLKKSFSFNTEILNLPDGQDPGTFFVNRGSLNPNKILELVRKGY